jgi:hypothetical protein
MTTKKEESEIRELVPPAEDLDEEQAGAARGGGQAVSADGASSPLPCARSPAEPENPLGDRVGLREYLRDYYASLLGER